MENYSEFSENEFKKSKFHSAALVNKSLDELWNDSFKDFRAGKYLSWDNDLDCIWTILGGEKGMKGSGEEKEYYEIQQKLTEIGELMDTFATTGFNKFPETLKSKLNKQKALLLKKALLLRRIQNSQGKGTGYEDEDEDDFD